MTLLYIRMYEVLYLDLLIWVLPSAILGMYFLWVGMEAFYSYIFPQGFMRRIRQLFQKDGENGP